MKLDFVNIVAIISAIIGIVIAIRTLREMVSDRKQRKIVENKIEVDVKDSEYKIIESSTYWLEHERQRNKGDHYDDESVYLNRAQTIRERTLFFSFINANDSLS